MEKWAEKFHLTIITKDSVDIEDIINSPQREPLHAPIREHPAENEDATERQNREARYTALLSIYNEEVIRGRQEDINKFNGLQIVDIDKKLNSQLYLALGKKGQKCFSQDNLGNRILDINFATFWQLLKTTFKSGTNFTYELFKFFSRGQKDNESLEKVYEIPTELAQKCSLGKLEAELVRDIFITTMGKVEKQKKHVLNS